MRAELCWIKADARHSFLDEPRVLPRGQAAPITMTREQELTRLTSRQTQVLVDRLVSLVCEFEPNWQTRLLLADGCAIHGVAVWCDIIDVNGNDIAAA